MKRIMIRDKGKGNISYYEASPYALKIKYFCNENGGFVDSYELLGEYPSSSDNIDHLISHLKKLIEIYELKQHSEHSKDILIIYTDNIDVAYGFLQKVVTDSTFEPHYVQILDFIEIRDISKWKPCSTVKEIYEMTSYLYKNVFIPEHYFYITPNQRPRRKIAKACDSDIAKDIFPDTYSFYDTLRKGLFGGLCYVPYPKLVIEEPIISFDLTSAYIFSLLCRKHCMSKFVNADPANYEYYVHSKVKSSFGCYKIHYNCTSTKISCFRNSDGEKCKTGDVVDTFLFNDVDLKTFVKVASVYSIECIWLYECNLDYLPKYFIDQVVDEYIKKINQGKIDKDAIEYILQKAVVNGLYGDCIRILKNLAEYKNAKYNAAIAPQWGIWTTSYTKEILLSCGLKIEGWIYSDTDSIYCLDTEENRAAIEEFNNKIRKMVKSFCDQFGYDYDLLKDLGTFKLENKIKKFRAMSQKVYMYTTTDNEFHLKAAGLNQDTINVDPDKCYNDYKLDWGYHKFSYIVPRYCEYTDGDKHYESFGFYYETSKRINESFFELYAQLALAKKQY